MKWKLIETDAASQHFWRERTDFRDGVDMMHVVNVYAECRYQTIRGFGGAFTEASGVNLSRLPEQVQEEVIRAYFGADGLCYNLGRTHINSCDFALGNYAYLEDAADTKMESFSLERDEQYLIPMIRRAMAAAEEPLELLASPWSPPAFMKTNGEMNHGGKLKKDCYAFWANYLARYIKEYQKRGLPIRMLTVQNESMATQTWDSCIYETEEECSFVRDYLGPVLAKEGLQEVGIYLWDHNKDILWERASGVLKDAAAAAYVEGVAFHWYSGDHFEAVALVRERYPKKQLLFTEGCVEYSRFADSSEVAKAEMYAHDILGNLAAGTNGYLDWNLLLDEHGGPNHVGNFCAAPIMCDIGGQRAEKRLTYYYIGQFSRYIRRGAVRLAVTRFSDRVEAVAFENPDGSRVVVLLNRTGEEISLSLREGTEGISFSLQPHTICTVCYEWE